MRRRMLRALATLVVAAGGVATAVGVVAASGASTTSVGDSTTPMLSNASGPNLLVQQVDPPSASYAIPAGNAVITGWQVVLNRAPASTPIVFAVVHPGTGNETTGMYTNTVASVITETTPATAFSSYAKRLSYPARMPVAPGDRLGIYVPANVDVGAAGSGDETGSALLTLTPSSPTTGAVLVSPGGYHTTRISLGATVEPDADGDTYGDATQDTCPLDPARQAPPCAGDLLASASVSPGTVQMGGVALVAAGATVAGGQPSNGKVTITLPAGLKLLSAAGPGGACAGAGPVVCPAGGTDLLAVSATKAGAATVGVAASADGPDPVAGNNIAQATLTVQAAPTTIKQCTVPPLAGLSQTKATSLLKTFGCALGKVTKPKVAKPKHGKAPKVTFVVSTSSPKLGTRAKSGTKVKLTLRAKKAK